MKHYMTYSLKHNNLRVQDIKDLSLMFEKIPHGSGIDYEWSITFTTNGIVLKNAIHCMNEYGYYDGTIPFKITLPWAKLGDFQLVYTDTRANKNTIRKYGNNYRDYIANVITYWLEDFGY